MRLKFSHLLVFLLLSTITIHAQQKSKPANDAPVQTQKQVVPDSLLPEYLRPYGCGGLLRGKLQSTVELTVRPELILPIPILTGQGISEEQSKSMFRRSVWFNLTGTDSEGTFDNPGGATNINLDREVILFLGKSPENKIDSLYAIQLQHGNILVIDPQTYFPLYIGSQYSRSPQDLQNETLHYRQAAYYWSAAYPWFFFDLSNVALKEALVNKNWNAIQGFAQYRYNTNFSIEELIAQNFNKAIVYLN